MLRRYRGMVLAFLIVATTLPALAAEQVAHLPPVKGFSSGRVDSVLTINDEPLIVVKGELATPTRFHGVLKTFPLRSVPGFGDIPEETYEVIVYDGAIYFRQGTDPEWYVTEDAYTQGATSEDVPQAVASLDQIGPIMHIGPATVADVATDQYQIWIGPPPNAPTPADDSLDHLTIDLWIGQQANYLYQFGLSAFGTDPQLGAVHEVFLSHLYDFETTSIVVGPPEHATPVQAVHPGFLAPLRLNGPLAAITAPLAAITAPLALPQLHRIAVQHLRR